MSFPSNHEFISCPSSSSATKLTLKSSPLALLRKLGFGKHVAMSEKTLFEKICDREIPAEIVFENNECFAFPDINPQAPTHILIVPRKPIPRVGLASSEDQSTLGALLLAVGEVARAAGIADTGFQVVINSGADGGETVPHLHIHLLGGRSLVWPPG